MIARPEHFPEKWTSGFPQKMRPRKKLETLMLHPLISSALVALGLTAATPQNATAQPFTEGAAGALIRDANALAAQIRGFHRWQGMTPPPLNYCATMQEGEAVQKQIARLASRAILYRRPGLALALQRAGDALSDELDVEEEVNHQANVPFTAYPCPAPPGPYPARPAVLGFVLAKMPSCRREADALRLSFEARRTLMQQCLRLPGQ
jgi:hypothetical protein